MTRDAAIALIASTNGKIFSATFVKRTNGELRTMLCRTGVTKHLRGGDPAYDANSKGLMFVFDMQKLAYRTVNLDPGTIIRFKRQTFVVDSMMEKAA